MNIFLSYFIKGFIYMLLFTLLLIPAVISLIVGGGIAGAALGGLGILITIIIMFPLMFAVSGFVISFLTHKPSHGIFSLMKRGFLMVMTGIMLSLFLPSADSIFVLLCRIILESIIYGFMMLRVVRVIK